MRFYISIDLPSSPNAAQNIHTYGCSTSLQADSTPTVHVLYMENVHVDSPLSLIDVTELRYRLLALASKYPAHSLLRDVSVVDISFTVRSTDLSILSWHPFINYLLTTTHAKSMILFFSCNHDSYMTPDMAL